MSSINPSDIENITVLKDAAAASLYGSCCCSPETVSLFLTAQSEKPQFALKLI